MFKHFKWLVLLLVASIASLFSLTSQAQTSIMTVDFELRDVSPLPNAPQEIERTALVDSVIKQTLAENGYALIPTCEALKKAADQGNSYLYDRPEIAGKLGSDCGADFVLMGQTWKPSFLFVFPQVQVVKTGAGLSRAELVVVSRVVQLEASTLDKNVTEAAARNLAKQIIEKLKSINK